MCDKSLVFSNLFTLYSFQIWQQKKKASPKTHCLSVLRVVLNTSLCPVCSCVLVFNTSSVCPRWFQFGYTQHLSLCLSLLLWTFNLDLSKCSCWARHLFTTPALLVLSSHSAWCSTMKHKCSTMWQCPPLRHQEDLVAALTMKSKVAQSMDLQ